MPPKTTKIDRDDLIEAFSEGCVLNALVKCLMLALTPAIEDMVRKQVETSVNESVEKTLTLIIDPQLKVLNETVSDLKLENENLKDKLNQQEAYSKAENILFYGVPENTSSDAAENKSATYDAIVHICNDNLGISIQREDLSIAHRLRKGKSGSTRPILVRFVSRQTRDDVYRARRLLKNSENSKTIFINEQLTKVNAEIYYRTRRLLRNKDITGTWTYGGDVFLKKTTSMEEKPARIRSLKDLATIDLLD